MSDRGSRDRQVMTLLVQLFGRDVMDRLAAAGFETPAVMARAGADTLAAEAGIPVAIARRVSIVVEESPGPAPTASSARTDSTTREKPAERAKPVEHAKPPDRSNAVEQDESDMLLGSDPLSEPTVREERRPARPVARKRSEPRVEVEPARPSTPAAPAPNVAPPAVAQPAEPAAAQATAASSAPASPVASASPAPSSASASSAAPATRVSYPDEGDPFVDDVALVSWMGLSSHQPDGRLAFTVSDTILDPVEAAAPAPAEAAPAKSVRPESPQGDSSRPAAATLIETPARPSLISGSFWTFGRPADSTPASTGTKPEPQPPAASPRRRKHDGH